PTLSGETRRERGGEERAVPERAEPFPKGAESPPKGSRRRPTPSPSGETRGLSPEKAEPAVFFFRKEPTLFGKELSSSRRFPERPEAGRDSSNPPPFRKNPKRLRKEPKALPERAEAAADDRLPGTSRSSSRKKPKRCSAPARALSEKPRSVSESPAPFRRAPKLLPESPEAFPEVAERRRSSPILRRLRTSVVLRLPRRPPPLFPAGGGPSPAPAAAGPGPAPSPPAPGPVRPGRMIKLFSLKQQKKEEESAGGTKGTSKKASAAQLRIQKDINELNLPKTCEIDFSDQDDLLHFRLLICPDEGFYKGGKFVFSFKVGQGYPHDPPKVKCETMVYHPNIDLEGNVCLNILREDWKPVLTINSIIYGLQYLFLEPNPEDPLNKEAAEVLQSNRRLFEQNVQRSLRGGYVGATYFERCLK
uniref:NEDD8-conjugating enzyme UBC12 n=1 Tax=Aquila chrysaetos chrysaetos TaxID=223781 RepID=A0A663FIT2_AQUCH